ncbi:MAG: hypothetical protein AAGI70_00535 [Pseudomonadota bacterium]
MLSKFIVTALVAALAWVLLSRGVSLAGRGLPRVVRRQKPKPPSETLIRCPRCDAYRVPGAPCDCPDA